MLSGTLIEEQGDEMKEKQLAKGVLQMVLMRKRTRTVLHMVEEILL